MTTTPRDGNVGWNRVPGARASAGFQSPCAAWASNPGKRAFTGEFSANRTQAHAALSPHRRDTSPVKRSMASAKRSTRRKSATIRLVRADSGRHAGAMRETATPGAGSEPASRLKRANWQEPATVPTRRERQRTARPSPVLGHATQATIHLTRPWRRQRRQRDGRVGNRQKGKGAPEGSQLTGATDSEGANLRDGARVEETWQVNQVGAQR